MIQIMKAKHLHLGVLASGRGSNFDAICRAIERNDLDAEISILISDHPDSAAVEKAAQRGIETFAFSPGDYSGRDEYEKILVERLHQKGVDILVMAGYMRLVGKRLLEAFENRVLNIHPALLPSFPGLHAQRQAVDYGVKFSGCTVHIVDEGMDTGPIIKQAVVPVYDYDDEDSLAARIIIEEHNIYWQSLQLFAEGRIYIDKNKVYVK